MNKYILAALSEGYLAHGSGAADLVATVEPCVQLRRPQSGLYLPIDGHRPRGIYRLSGYRGISRFVEITQQAKDMVGPLKAVKPSPLSNDLDSLHIGKDGYFSAILSAQRPADYRATGGCSISARSSC